MLSQMSDTFSLDEKNPIVNVDLHLPQGVDVEGRLLDAMGLPLAMKWPWSLRQRRGAVVWVVSGVSDPARRDRPVRLQERQPRSARLVPASSVAETGYRPPPLDREPGRACDSPTGEGAARHRHRDRRRHRSARARPGGVCELATRVQDGIDYGRGGARGRGTDRQARPVRLQQPGPAAARIGRSESRLWPIRPAPVVTAASPLLWSCASEFRRRRSEPDNRRCSDR